MILQSYDVTYRASYKKNFATNLEDADNVGWSQLMEKDGLHNRGEVGEKPKSTLSSIKIEKAIGNIQKKEVKF